MLSRWTNFLTEDGEKDWRNREDEFVESYDSKETMIAEWERGWECVFGALNQINPGNFDTIIRIRGEDHTITEAINRQLAHYANHVGQIVLMGKMIRGNHWKSLSIPKGASEAFNRKKFNKDNP